MFFVGVQVTAVLNNIQLPSVGVPIHCLYYSVSFFLFFLDILKKNWDPIEETVVIDENDKIIFHYSNVICLCFDV